MDSYIVCPASASTVLGTAPTAPKKGTGDNLERLIITVNIAATAIVQVQDGSDAAITIMPNSPGGGIGVYVVTLDMISKSGKWTIIVGAGSTVVAVGRFLQG
jgi:hypothetical protein